MVICLANEHAVLTAICMLASKLLGIICDANLAKDAKRCEILRDVLKK